MNRTHDVEILPGGHVHHLLTCWCWWAGMTAPSEPPKVTLNDIIEMFRNLKPITPAEPIEVTRAQWEALKAACPPGQHYGMHSGALGALLGVPIVIVEPAEEMGPPRIRDRVVCAWQVVRDAVRRAFGGRR